ncbi:MAG TPA: alpha/beta fold hydrolase [Sphingomonas sp.]
MRIVGLTLAGVFLLLVVLGFGGWLYLRAPDIPAATLEARYGRPNSHYVDLADGIRLHYLESGPAGAPTLLLVHGFGDNSFSWDGWTKVLARDHHVLAIDLPGHGLTRAPADFVAAPDRIADVVGGFLARQGLSRVAVAGNSLGGAVAWQLALRHPEAVGALILVDAAGWPNQTLQKPPLAFRLMRYKLGRDLIASIDNTPLIRQGLRKDVVDQSVLTEAFIGRWADLQRLPGHRPILMSLNPGAIAASNDVLAPIRVPTLILWGADDQLIDVASAHKFAAAIPGSELIIYPEVGHLAMVDAPDRTARDVAAFLARHRG